MLYTKLLGSAVASQRAAETQAEADPPHSLSTGEFLTRVRAQEKQTPVSSIRKVLSDRR